jgi:prephenate dehydratase
MARAAYLGPPGTFSEEALLAAGGDLEPVPLATVRDVVLAVQAGDAERGLVPIESAIEGSVDATLDTLAVEAPDVAIVGEVVRAVRHNLIAAAPLELGAIVTVATHPQAGAQCAGFLRAELPRAQVVSASSTAEAVRLVSQRREEPWAAIGTRRSAELYECTVLREGIEDSPDNATRFVWLAPAGAADGAAAGGPAKTSVVFWGAGTDAPGWLVRCLSEFAFRGVNLNRIESRPRRAQLGAYMFFVDLEGRAEDPPVAAALEGLRAHCDAVRVIGSYPAA